MRIHRLVLFVLLPLGQGCGESAPATTASVQARSPAQEAARVFGLADGLEKEGKSKEAFAAYRQVADKFPETPDGKKAAARIKKAQAEALRKVRRAKPG